MIESKFKVFVGFIISASIVLSLHGYYFDLKFFDPTPIGFAHDVMPLMISCALWAMGGMFGWYRK